jgi:HTH-type transcriptional regulator, sugar sensing transcriptional regulator
MTTQPADGSDLVDRLVRYGLGHGEARCYVAMLAPRAFRVGEVARQAGLPRSRAYELVRSLVRSGLCTEVAGSGAARFRALPPNEAIGRLEAFAGQQARRRGAALSGVLRALGDRLARPGDHQDPVDLLRSQDQVLDGRDRAMRAAEHEVLAVAAMPSEPLGGTTVPARPRPGVRVRAVLAPADAVGPQQPRAARPAGHGVEVRVVERVPTQYTLFDRRTVLLELGAAGSGDAQPESLLIRHAGLAEVLHEAFERLWESGQPPGEAGGVQTDNAGEAVPGDDRQVRFPRPG